MNYLILSRGPHCNLGFNIGRTLAVIYNLVYLHLHL
jgi:hypothetical protein